MPTIAEWIESKWCKQPEKGFIPLGLFTITQIYMDEDAPPQGEENIRPQIVERVVSSLAKYMLNMGDFFEAFSGTMKGIGKAAEKNDMEYAKEGMDLVGCMCDFIFSEYIEDDLIVVSCKLVTWDIYLRTEEKIPISSIEPDDETIENIRIMIERTVTYVKSKGKYIITGFSLKRPGKTKSKNIEIQSGDFLAEECLIDIKVSKSRAIKKEETLKVFAYWLLGQELKDNRFETIKELVIFNPDLNLEYSMLTSSVPESTVKEIKKQLLR